MSKINKHGGIHGTDGKFTGHVGGQPATGLPSGDGGWLENADLEELAGADILDGIPSDVTLGPGRSGARGAVTYSVSSSHHGADNREITVTPHPDGSRHVEFHDPNDETDGFDETYHLGEEEQFREDLISFAHMEPEVDDQAHLNAQMVRNFGLEAPVTSYQYTDEQRPTPEPETTMSGWSHPDTGAEFVWRAEEIASQHLGDDEAARRQARHLLGASDVDFDRSWEETMIHLRDRANLDAAGDFTSDLQGVTALERRITAREAAARPLGPQYTPVAQGGYDADSESTVRGGRALEADVLRLTGAQINRRIRSDYRSARAAGYLPAGAEVTSVHRSAGNFHVRARISEAVAARAYEPDDEGGHTLSAYGRELTDRMETVGGAYGESVEEDHGEYRHAHNRARVQFVTQEEQ